MRQGLFNAIGSALDGLNVAFCAFDNDDRTIAWNRTFLEIFSEHAGFVHAGEPYADNLRRFYRGRLGASEIDLVEQYVAEGIKRHREQRRPYEFDHRGSRVRVSSVEIGLLGRIRVWRRVSSAEIENGLRPAAAGIRFEPREASILERLPDGVLVVNSGDRVAWANQSFLALYGLASIDAAFGRRFEDIYREVWSIAPIDPRFVESFGTLRDNQRFSGAPFELALPDRRWVRVIEQRETATNGTGYFVHVDITKLKRQEAALRAAEVSSRESEARVREVTDHVPILITEWSPRAAGCRPGRLSGDVARQVVCGSFDRDSVQPREGRHLCGHVDDCDRTSGTAVIVKEGFPFIQANAATAGHSAALMKLVWPSMAGMVMSFAAGLGALRWLSRWLKQGRWHYFGFYCVAGSVFVLAARQWMHSSPHF